MSFVISVFWVSVVQLLLLQLDNLGKVSSLLWYDLRLGFGRFDWIDFGLVIINQVIRIVRSKCNVKT